ncbi:MAG: 30S ribosomal protein S12 methylthiotransferase RimO [bacterium]|nr:30S ribosomal protein S12 methylthiotransferase RimO [bacterium]
MPRRVAFHTLGCPKNAVDSETLATLLRGAGYECGGPLHRADVLVVNTCGFLDDAKIESVETLLGAAQWKRAKRGRRVFVMGCLTQRDGREIASEIPELDGVFGIGEWTRMLLALGADPVAECGASVTGLSALANPGSAYLRISDGCSHECAFCSIPQMRGLYRSEPLAILVGEAERLAAGGVKEIILIGQETTSYGADLYRRRALPELCRRIGEIEGIAWIRILYAHPPSVSIRLLRDLAEIPKLVPYLDYPIEHASDKILKAMNRRTTAARMKSAISAFRAARPGVCVRSTALVGFPGETDEDFETLYRFAEDVRFERLGVFVYSPQEATAGFALGDPVEEGIALDRLDRLMTLQKRICREHHQALVGRTLPVLVERASRGISWGRTTWDAPEIDGRVRLTGEAHPGALIAARIERAHAYQLDAIPVPGRSDIGE